MGSESEMEFNEVNLEYGGRPSGSPHQLPRRPAGQYEVERPTGQFEFKQVPVRSSGYQVTHMGSGVG